MKTRTTRTAAALIALAFLAFAGPDWRGDLALRPV